MGPARAEPAATFTTLAPMQDSDLPQPGSPGSPVVPSTAPGDAGDAELDGFDADFETVAGALDALDAEDLDTAEARVEQLSDPTVTAADTDPA